jgi:hypothetical protein
MKAESIKYAIRNCDKLTTYQKGDAMNELQGLILELVDLRVKLKEERSEHIRQLKEVHELGKEEAVYTYSGSMSDRYAPETFDSWIANNLKPK